MYAAWDSANDKLAASEVADGDVRAILTQIPGFPPALRWIAEKHVASKHPVHALNLDLMVLVNGTEHHQDCQRLLGLLESWSRDSRPDAVEKEYQEMVKSFLDVKIPPSLIQDGAAAKVIERVWLTQGHVNFPELAAASRRNKLEVVQ